MKTRPRTDAGAGKFRLHLRVAMMLTITAVTALALYFAERNLAAGVRQNLQREFQSEVGALLGAQEARLAALTERCRALAKSVRIRAALEEGDVADLYLNARVELRDLLASKVTGGKTEAPALRAEFFRFLDASGAVLPVPREDGENAESWQWQPAASGAVGAQEVGYVMAKNADGREMMIEVIATPIVATDTGEVIGAIMLGFKPVEIGATGAGIRSGIFSQGRLHMPGLTAPVEVLMNSTVTDFVNAPTLTDSNLAVQVDGMPHLLFYKLLNPGSHFPQAYEICVYPLADALARQRHLRWEIIGAGVLLLLGGLVASHFVSARLAVPVEKMAVDSAEDRTHRAAAEAELELTHDELRARNAELQKALAELTAAQEHIIQQERLRALGQMASGIAHDFNNALVPILGFCELLLLKPAILQDPQKATRYLETIQTAAKDAASVVSRLREFYRPNKGERAFEPVSLKRLVEQAVTLTKPKWKDQAQAAGATVEIALELDAVPPVAGEESALREVLTNLIFNAVDAMPAGGTLTLRTVQRGDTAVLEVADTGTGMTEETRQRCLEPFYSTKGERGTGLGLSMVFGIVQRHSGALDIRSTVGVGTTFVITLPLQDAPVRAVTAAPERPAQRPLRVLVVDDETPVRDTLSAVLAADGHDVQLATDGADGLRRFDAGTFDLVITDKAMPAMNGDQMAAAIKFRAPKMPIILLTGFGLFHEKDEFPDVDVLISKPVRIPALRDAIATATQPA